jgi:hypothetical protein
MSSNACRRTVVTLIAAVIVTGAGVTVLAQAPAGIAPPAAVKKAFDQAYPGASIAATTQERDGSRTLFRIDSLQKGRRRIVQYDANAAVIEVAEQVQEQELPAPVAAAMHSHPRAIYVSGLKVTRGKSVEYRLTVRGTRKTNMVAKPDGTVLSFK